MRPTIIMMGMVIALLPVGGIAQEKKAVEQEITQDMVEQMKRENAPKAVQPNIKARQQTRPKPVPNERVQTEPARISPTTGDVRLPPDAYVERRFKNFKCPAELKFPAETTFTSKTGLKFVEARANPGGCQFDLNPETDKGGFCMSCAYEGHLAIRRSSGSNYKCWVSDSHKDELTCEYVAPLPPSQTCVFDIRLPIVDLMPYTQHTKGDKDLHSYSNIFGLNHVDLRIIAEIQRGIGPQSDALFVVLSATHTEGGGDKTTFKKDFAVKLEDQHYVNATAVDVANCLASYGSQRPLSINPKGDIGGRSLEGHNWETIENTIRRDLIRKAECRFDTKYSDDMKRVGCRKIWFDQDVTVRLN